MIYTCHSYVYVPFYNDVQNPLQYNKISSGKHLITNIWFYSILLIWSPTLPPAVTNFEIFLFRDSVKVLVQLENLFPDIKSDLVKYVHFFKNFLYTSGPEELKEKLRKPDLPVWSCWLWPKAVWLGAAPSPWRIPGSRSGRPETAYGSDPEPLYPSSAWQRNKGVCLRKDRLDDAMNMNAIYKQKRKNKRRVNRLNKHHSPGNIWTRRTSGLLETHPYKLYQL